MAELTTSPNIPDPDDMYARLIAVHDGLSEEESMTLNARLVLILANHIGDPEVLHAALHMARDPSAKT